MKESVEEFVAQGGEIVDYQSYRAHMFYKNGNFEVVSGSKALEVFVLGGGGSGGTKRMEGGQGGGAVQTTTPGVIRPGSYRVTVGDGGTHGGPGADSFVFGIKALGGKDGNTEKGIVKWANGSDDSVFFTDFSGETRGYGGSCGSNLPESSEANGCGQFPNGGGGGFGELGDGFSGLVIIRYLN